MELNIREAKVWNCLDREWKTARQIQVQIYQDCEAQMALTWINICLYRFDKKYEIVETKQGEGVEGAKPLYFRRKLSGKKISIADVSNPVSDIVLGL
jgi:hypothetical protein